MTAFIIAAWFLIGIPSAFAAGFFLTHKKKLTRGRLVLTLVLGCTGPVALLAAFIWGLCWIAEDNDNPVSRWWNTPL